MDIIQLRIRPTTDEDRAALPDSVQDSAFTFQVEASNLNLDFYYTHMTRKTLRNFVNGAKAGVAFLDSHNNRNLGYGRTYGGRVRIDAGREVQFVAPDGVELAIEPPSQYALALLDVFTVPGINFGGGGPTYASTDDFIRSVNAGIAQDVSVGFGGGFMRCDICGNNYRSYRDCSHYAGNVYALGDAGERQVLATVAIDGANLHEVSAVYDGATPNATIRKAIEAGRAGELDREIKQLLEVRYQIDIPTGRIFPAVNGRQADTEDTHMDLEQAFEQIRAILAETSAPEGVEITEAVRWLAGEVERLRPLADAGRQYRTDLIEQALKEGVRAVGETFQQEAYRGMLENSSMEVIKRMAADWKAIGDKRFQSGRQTTDEGEPAPEGQQDSRPLVPDEAFSS